MGFDLGQERLGALGRRVTAIGDGVNADILEPASLGPMQEAAQVVDVAVDAAVGAESDQVQGFAAALQLLG